MQHRMSTPFECLNVFHCKSNMVVATANSLGIGNAHTLKASKIMLTIYISAIYLLYKPQTTSGKKMIINFQKLNGCS